MPTLSVIKADVGGYVGHADVHPDLMVRAAESLDKAKADGLLIDCQVQHVGDDIALVMTHEQGEDAEPIHKLAWDTFLAVTKVARELKMYGAGQDLLSDAFSGNIKGMGPGSAEVEFEERTSEPDNNGLRGPLFKLHLSRPRPHAFDVSRECVRKEILAGAIHFQLTRYFRHSQKRIPRKLVYGFSVLSLFVGHD